jgi:cellulose synthase (UDP-forming)
MTPQVILSLWRERWGKAESAPRHLPYIDGKVATWGRGLSASPVWGVPLMGWLVGVLCGLLLIFVATVSLSPKSQYVFSIFVLGLSFLLRRYSGTFVTLVLLALAVMASSRYLFWRLTGTLVQDFSWDFIFGFVLWAAELHFCVLVGLKCVTQIWPIQRALGALPDEDVEWPSLDILVPCQGQSPSQVLEAATAALALTWPPEKIQIHLVDDKARSDIAELAESLHVHYIFQGAEEVTVGGLNHAVQLTKGQLVVVLGLERFPAPNFLNWAVGAFLHDDRLGMVHTARHFLVPKPSAFLGSFLGNADGGCSCVILRRSAISDEEGILCESVIGDTHTALKLDALGYSHACIGFGTYTGGEITRARLTTAGLPAVATIFLIDKPFLQHSLAWRRRSSLLRDALEFYYPVAQAIFFLAPTVYLLGGAQLAPVSGDDFSAYAFPHLLQGLMATARLRNPSQMGALAYVRETFLAWYIFVLTALTLTKTQFTRQKYTISASSPVRLPSGKWRANLRHVCGVLFLLVVLLLGGGRLLEGTFHEQDALVLCLLWIAHHFFTLMAKFAVAQESRQIEWHQKLTLQVPAVVKLNSGHSLRCTTQNFPQMPLALQFPLGVVVGGAAVQRISMFLGGREFVFPVRESSLSAGFLHVHLGHDLGSEFDMLLRMSRSRGANWPEFLPGERADRPLPPWLTRPIVKLVTKVSDYLADLVINWSKKK